MLILSTTACNIFHANIDFFSSKMVHDNPSENEPADGLTNGLSIDDIDANGYLISNVEQDKRSDRPDDVDVSQRWDGEGPINGNIIGKVFDTPDDAYTFYNQYAFTHGFGIRKHWDYKNKVTNEVYRNWYVCNKEGFKNVKDDSTSVDTKKRCRDLRTGCQARLRITITKDERWCVDFFDDTHNHDLSITPTKVMKHRSHGKFHRCMACKSLMLEIGQSGMRPCHVKKAVNEIKPPYVADVTSKQCSDNLSEQRKQYKGKEFYGLIKHFQDKASVDMNQYFKIDLNSDGSPRNIFWADGRSRDAYIKFGDVVVFDVTYLTNKFKFPFAPFVGVNHHGQSILFGAALLENEKEETFQWLFEQFLVCMFDKYPASIITDQDKAICNAIHKVFPNTRHRYCSWHVKKHQLEHLRPFKARYSDFNESYKKWVKSDTIEEFETQWDVLRDKYDLKSSNWMMEMYDQRKYWVWSFLKDGFFAGMTTSGQSESIHSFFDGFVNSNTMLNEFVIQYDKAVNSRRAAEEDEDFKTMNSRAVLSSVHPIEAKAGKCYTRKIFEKFEKEWKEATNNLTHNTLNKSLEQVTYSVGQVNVEKKYWRTVNFSLLNKVDATCSCAMFETYGKCYTRKIFEKFEKEWKEATNNLTHNTLNKSLEQVTYSVGQVNVEKKYWRTVNFSLLNKVDATCSCAMFETYGILCKHILYVMKKKHVETLPDQYILPRWTLDSRYKAGNHSIGIKEINNESGVSALTLWCVHSNSTKAIEQAKDCPSEITRLNTILVKFLEDQISRKKAKESEDVFEDNSVGASQVDMMPQICVRDPVVKTKTKGRPKIATRVKSPIELFLICKAKNDNCNALLANATYGVKKKKTDG
ncbi:FAR1-related sequence 5-like protein [Tanacetum coccineum]